LFAHIKKKVFLVFFFFFFVLFHQPTLHGVRRNSNYYFLKNIHSGKKNVHFVNIELNLWYQIVYGLFIMAIFYTSSFLPYGRFYNRLGGNKAMLLAYFYTLIYLSFSFIRKPKNLNFYLNDIFYKVKSIV